MKATNIKVRLSIGAPVIKTLLPEMVHTLSFASSLIASANGTRRPHRPILFGPFRICINPSTLRSIKV